MKHVIKTTQDGEITIIAPENGGEAVCRVFKPEFAQAIADGVNAYVPPHPIECEDRHNRQIEGMRALAEAELMPADPSTLVMTGFSNMDNNAAPEKRLMTSEEVQFLAKLVAGEDVLYLGNPYKLTPTLQPVPSESEEAVAREIEDGLKAIAYTGQTQEPDHFAYRTMARNKAARLLEVFRGRHRQPAAVKTQSAAEIASNIQRALVAEGVHVSPSVRIKCILPYVGQPAAVSADAVERYKAALETIRTGDCVPWDIADKALKQQHNGS